MLPNQVSASKKTHNTSKKTVRYDIHEKFSENKSQQPNKQNCM